MRQYITNSLDINIKVTSESSDCYICNNQIFKKSDIISDYHPMDDLKGILHLVVVPFYN